jgi:magnesium-transporting ATPase (P-type)
MKKLFSVMFSVGLIISSVVGFLHFFAPYAFEWYGYIPDAPEAITVSVDYINFFFSLLLTGFSIILLLMKKKIFTGSKEIFVFYGFLVFTWLCRVIITVIIPWPSSLQTWLLVGFGTEFILTFLPLWYLLQSKIIQFHQ